MLKRLKNDVAEVIFDTLGVQLQSFQVEGKEYLWQRDETYWGKTAPVLFPYIGAVPEEPVEIYGIKTAMPRHGFIKDTEMDMEFQTNTRYVYTTTDTEKTWEMYPYHFKFTAAYELKGNKLSLHYIVENTDDSKELPFLIGGHPGFFCPMNEGEAFTDYQIVFNRKENDPGLVDGTTLPLSYDLFPIDAYVVDDVQSDKVSLVNKNTGQGIEFGFYNFKMMAIWTPPHKNAPFVCLEPWCNGTFDTLQNVEFSQKKHLQKLAPGQSREYRFTIQPI